MIQNTEQVALAMAATHLPPIGREADEYLEIMRDEAVAGIWAVLHVDGAIIDHHIHDLTASLSVLGRLGLHAVVLHSAEEQVASEMEKTKTVIEKRDGVTVFDSRTIETVQRQSSRLNVRLRSCLQLAGVPAFGLEYGVFAANPRNSQKYGRAGVIERVNDDIIRSSLHDGVIPVVSSLADGKGAHRLTITKQEATSALVSQLQPSRVVLLSEQGGVTDLQHRLVPTLTAGRAIDDMVQNGNIPQNRANEVRFAAGLVGQLPETSSVVLTSAAQLLTELFTHAGAGTMVRREEQIIVVPLIKIAKIDAVRQLVEESFGGVLDATYFDQLPGNAEIHLTRRHVKGAAIVLPGALNGDGVAPGYMDKLVVSPQAQGLGIGKQLLEEVFAKHAQAGIYWRSSIHNPNHSWYTRTFDLTTHNEGDWTVFMKNIPEDQQQSCIKDALSRPTTIIYPTA